MRSRILQLILVLFIISIAPFVLVETVEGAPGDDNIYDIPNAVKSGWNSIRGDKGYSFTSGKRLIYDIYNNKYVSSGYEVVNKDFGKGSQPYIHFAGWAVLAGYTEHTDTNQDTFIVAQKMSGDSGIGSTKIYKSVQYWADATEDLEYNNQGSGVWNECPAGTYNKQNDTCNMRYADVNFQVFLPLNELFTENEKASWSLYIVKKVENRIVYSQLVLPFDFTDKKFLTGKLNLSSGVDNDLLTMNSEGVLRRKEPREVASSVIDDLGTDRYFVQGSGYEVVDSEESEVAIWYGVKSPKDSNKTKWANTAYWNFSGDQAKLSYQPNRPPTVNWSWVPSNTVYNDTDVTTDNQSTDPDGDTLTYLWEKKTYGASDSTFVTVATTKNLSTRNLPKGKWTYRLTVSDGKVTAEVGRAITVQNRAPEIDFSYDTGNTVYNNTSIGIIPKVKDADGDALTYKWEKKPYGSADTNYEVFSTKAQPDNVTWSKGSYTLQLTVSDGEESVSVRHYLYVINRDPTINFSYDTGNTVYNDTTVGIIPAVSDPDGDSLSYTWERKVYGSDDSTYELFSTKETPDKFILPKGNYTFQLKVSDGEVTKDIRRYLYVINRPPVANFDINPTTVYKGANITFNDTSIDLDKDALTYKWEYKIASATTWTQFSTAQNPVQAFNTLDTYDVRLTVTDTSGEVSTVNKSFTVTPKPLVADFTYSPTTVYNNTTVTFTNGSDDPDGGTLSYKWEYQKPNTTTWTQFATTVNPTSVFNQIGTWNVRLTATTSTGKTASKVKMVTVTNRAPTAYFDYSPSTIYNDTTVSFANTSSDADGDTLTYKWEYQQPNSTTWTQFSTAQNPTKVLNIKGTWSIRLTVTDSQGATDVLTRTPSVRNRAPVVAFTFSPTTIYSNTTVTFANTSSDADADTLSYKWEYQEPNSTTWNQFSTSKDPTRVFTSKGVNKVRLTVSDGETSTVLEKSLTVTNRAPVADFTYAPTTIYKNTVITLTNKSSDADGDTVTYKWEYLKPNTTTWVQFSTSKDPTLNPTEKGTWGIRLTVSDGSLTNTKTESSIEVLNRPPVVGFTYSPSTIYNNTNVTFTNSTTDSDNDTLTYKWEYKKPNTTTWVQFSTAKDPTYTLNQKGVWEVRLTANDGTDSVTLSKNITVSNRAPVADFSYSPSTIYNNTTVTLTNKSTDADGDTLTYKWSYQKPNTTTWVDFATTKDTTSILNQKGDWNVRLIITDTDGVTAEKISIVKVVNRAPVADFKLNKTTYMEGDTFSVIGASTDPDGDSITYSYSVVSPSGATQTFTTANFLSKFTESGVYKITLTVKDTDGATGIVTKNVTVNELKIVGKVSHTDDWKSIHESKGEEESMFYSGEKFILTATVTDSPITSVQAEFKGVRIDGTNANLSSTLASSHPTYTGEIYDESFSDPLRKLRNGSAVFVFTAKWSNGITKSDIVTINIVDNVYSAFDLYKSN